MPALLRHCVVAVYAKSTGGGPDGVVKAFKICRDTLAKSGYLAFRGSGQILDNIQLTGKGYERNLKHQHEGVHGGAVDVQFKKLFQMIEPRLYEYDGPGGLLEPPQMPSADPDGQDQDANVHAGLEPQETVDFIDPLYWNPKS